MMSDVTQILSQIEAGDPLSADKLLPLVYDELRKLAAARMKNEQSDHTLQATALVHEAWMRLVDVDVASKWNSRGHFFAAAAEAMRRILVEHARRKNRRDVLRTRMELDAIEGAMPARNDDVLAVSDALDKLAIHHPEKANLVKLRYFARLTLAEAADALGFSSATADRHWKYARAWLCRELQTAAQDGN